MKSSGASRAPARYRLRSGAGPKVAKAKISANPATLSVLPRLPEVRFFSLTANDVHRFDVFSLKSWF
jgi:hypothetical protein